MVNKLIYQVFIKEFDAHWVSQISGFCAPSNLNLVNNYMLAQTESELNKWLIGFFMACQPLLGYLMLKLSFFQVVIWFQVSD